MLRLQSEETCDTKHIPVMLLLFCPNSAVLPYNPVIPSFALSRLQLELYYSNIISTVEANSQHGTRGGILEIIICLF